MRVMEGTARPILGREVYIAPTAYVAGDVVLGDQVTIMHHVMIRGDIAPIRVGARVNVQDGSILHTKRGVALDIADDVAIGHRAVVHGRRVGPRTLIGIGAIVLDDCEIGSRCIIAAGAVLAPGTLVPDGKVVMGAPGKVVRDALPRDLEMIDQVVSSYMELGRRHAALAFPNIAGG
jgi:carbonic anhydrase/acetyltransferase-like protein (isoleucine patch superfamily)